LSVIYFGGFVSLTQSFPARITHLFLPSHDPLYIQRSSEGWIHYGQAMLPSKSSSCLPPLRQHLKSVRVKQDRLIAPEPLAYDEL